MMIAWACVQYLHPVLALLQSPFGRAASNSGFEVFRYHVLAICSDLASRTLPPVSTGPLAGTLSCALVGPLLCGMIGGCGGAFMPLSNGLKALEHPFRDTSETPPRRFRDAWDAPAMHLPLRGRVRHLRWHQRDTYETLPRHLRDSPCRSARGARGARRSRDTSETLPRHFLKALEGSTIPWRVQSSAVMSAWRALLAQATPRPTSPETEPRVCRDRRHHLLTHDAAVRASAAEYVPFLADPAMVKLCGGLACGNTRG